jgi:hypothetical protein
MVTVKFELTPNSEGDSVCFIERIQTIPASFQDFCHKIEYPIFMRIIEEFLKLFASRSPSPIACLSRQKGFPGPNEDHRSDIQYIICRDIQFAGDLRPTQISIAALPIASTQIRFAFDNSLG